MVLAIQSQRQKHLTRCDNHKLGFEYIGEDLHRAYDLFCGTVDKNGDMWYCSEKCMNDEPKLKYKKSNEEISND